MSEKIPNIVIIAFVLSFILPIVGLVLGIIALKKVNKTEERSGKGLAIAAIVIGAVLTIPAMIMIIGAMSYFMVLSPSTFIPERCVIQTGIECEVNNLNNVMEISIKNRMGRNLVSQSLTLTYEHFSCSSNKEEIIEADETLVFNFEECQLSDLGQRKIRFDLDFVYYPEEAGEQFKTSAKGNFIIDLN